MKKNTIQLVVSAVHCVIEVQGDGDIPCLCIGIGSLMQRTLSEKFKRTFKAYAMDLYFAQGDGFDSQSITMSSLVDDIIEVAKQLGLKKYLILGHSCLGILALEVAKRNPCELAGIILVAAAPEWNEESLARTQQYFIDHASPERKQNDQLRRAAYEAIKKPTDSEATLERYIADTARYWGNFNIDEHVIYQIWQGIVVNDEFTNHYFLDILPQHNLADGIDKIKMPVILLAGRQDYDSIPLVHWQHYAMPQDFTVIDCGDVGHWPNFEAADAFDNAVIDWFKEKYQ